MQQLERNNSDPLERIACPIGGGPKPPCIVRHEERPKANHHPDETLKEILVYNSPGPVSNTDFIRFLLTPEDTTETDRKTGWAAPIVEPRTAADMIKAFFWIIVAVLFSLMLAQLH